MADSNNGITRFAEEWFSQDQIDEARSNSLQLERIDQNSTIAAMVETIDANFREIARHGGGPAGMDGVSGLNGEDGVNVEYIYALCDMMEAGTHYPTDDSAKYNLFTRVKNSGSANHNGVTWHDHAQPISSEHKNEYVFSRFRRSTDTDNDDVTSWIYDTAPVLWAHWGETGQDGDGVEYIFLTSNEELSNSELYNMIMKKSEMDEFQKAIYNIDGFYPGSGWFTAKNKTAVQAEFQRLGLDMSDTTFSSRWSEKFGFCAYGEWTSEPVGTAPDRQYEYVSIRRSSVGDNDSKVWGDYSLPALWSNYTFEGRIFIIYKNTLATEKPSGPAKGAGWWDVENDKLVFSPAASTGATAIPEGWTDNNVNAEDGEITWMCSGIFNHSGKNVSWSNPACISGKDGKAGEDGTTIEFIYALSQNPSYPRTLSDKEALFNAVENDTEHNPKYSVYGSTKWFDRAQPISPQDPTEYMWARRREKETDPWEYDLEPIIWAHWGEDGTDGDGVEYIFTVTDIEDPTGLVLPKKSSLDESQMKIFQIDDFVPAREWFAKARNKEKAMEALGEAFDETRWNNYYGFDVTTGWKDNPIPVDHFTPFQWVSVRRSTADEVSGDRIWEDFSDPVLWNSYGKSTRVFIIYCNMPSDEEHPDREIPNKPVDGTGKWVYQGEDNYLDLTGVVDALTGVTPQQKELNIGVWNDKNSDVRGTISWMCSGVFTDDGENVYWSEPFRISGEKGEPGEDGDNIEFIYCLSTGMPAHPIPNDNMTDEEYDNLCAFFENIDKARKANPLNPSDPVNEGLDIANIHIDENGVAYYEYNDGTTSAAWYDNPQGIDDIPGKRTEWVWQRSKAFDETRWTFTPQPVPWSHWGEDGTDGDGVEYVFHLSQHNNDQFPTNELPPVKPESMSSNRDICRVVIYNTKDFYPDKRWFTEDTDGDGIVDGRQLVEAVIVDGGLMSQSEFDDLWNAEITAQTYFDLDKEWVDDPQETSFDYPFQFVSIRKSYTNPETEKKEWGPYSTPKLWSRYLIQTRVFMVYCNVDEGITPTVPALDYGWWAGDDRLKAGENDPRPYECPAYDKDNPLTQVGVWVDSDVYQAGKIAWICSVTFAENGVAVSASEPFRITGDRGRPGADGSTIEFVYARCDVEADLRYPNPETSTYEQLMEFFDNVENAASTDTDGSEAPNVDENGKAYYDYNGTHWYDNPQGVSAEEGRRKEWVWSRNKTAGDAGTLWTVPPKPVIWSHWGEDGTDGDGVEYIFSLGASDTYGVSEESWNAYFDVFNSNDTAKAVYSMDDFIPSILWFANPENKTAVEQKMHDEEMGEFSETDYDNLDDYLNAVIPWGNLGVWSDNPSDVSVSYPYLFVSIRKSENGVWGPFSYPKIWGNYSASKFTTFAFTVTETDVDLSEVIPTGGDYNSPLPNPSVVNGNTYNWTDGPEPDSSTGKIIVWMTSARVVEGENISSWTAPQKMNDSAGFQVEWCSAENVIPTVKEGFESDDFNYEIFLKMNDYDEDAAEEAWRLAVKNGYMTEDSQAVEGLNLVFGDDAEHAIYMATCQIKKGVWTNWKLTKVKGEQGEVGPEGRSINVKGFIRYEYYLDEGVEYTEANAQAKFDDIVSDIIPAPNVGDLLIIYPHDMAENDVYYGLDNLGGALCMWKFISGQYVDSDDDGAEPEYFEDWVPYYKETQVGADENIGDTYTSPNHHLILWDGDSWQDVGNLVGPTGPAGEILVKYAMDDTDVVVSEGNPIPKRFAEDDEIPFAKYIGFITYPEGQRPGWSYDPNGVGPNGETWNWSLFRGQDGYGYEFIYRASATYDNNIVIPPQQPGWSTTPNVIPQFWTDEPIEPSLPDNKYVWMAWRKYDIATQTWSEFYGSKTSPRKPLLWAVFMSTITDVNEYYHVDTVISPTSLDEHFGTNRDRINNDDEDNYWTDKATALENWDSDHKYLFNVEVITYTGGRIEILNPHLISVYADGIVDIIEYYCLGDNGSNAPSMKTATEPYLENTIVVAGEEGLDYWTTDTTKTEATAEHRYLWNINYKIFEDTDKNYWSVPLVVGVYGQGANGEDSVYADLDNEMDAISVATNEDGIEVVSDTGQLFTTTVTMYRGTTPLKIKSCSVSGEDGLHPEFYLDNNTLRPYTEGETISGGAYSVTMKLDPANFELAEKYNKVVFTVMGMDPANTVRTISYTLVAIDNPSTYSIVLSDNSIVIERAGNLKKPAVLNISVVQNTGVHVRIYDGYNDGNNPFKLYLKLNDNDTDATEITSATFTFNTNGTYILDGHGTTARQLKAGDKLTFTIDVDYVGDDSVFETTIDTETIFVLKEGSDGNGYEYSYFRYDVNASYGSNVTPGVSQATASDTPVFLIGSTPISVVTSEPMGADADYPYEYRSQRSGYDETWSKWSTPVTVAKYLDGDNIERTLRNEIANARSEFSTSMASSISGVYNTLGYLSGFISKNGTYSGSFSSKLTSGIATVVSSKVSTTLNGLITNVSGVSTFAAWVNLATSQMNAVSTIQTANASMAQQITTLEGTVDADITGIRNEMTVIADERLARLETNVGNTSYLTDGDGFYLMKKPKYTPWCGTESKLTEIESSINGLNQRWILIALRTSTSNTTYYNYNPAPYPVEFETKYNTDRTKCIVILKKTVSSSSMSSLKSTLDNYKTGLANALKNSITIKNVTTKGTFDFENSATSSSYAYNFNKTAPSSSSAYYVIVVCWAVVNVQTADQTSLTWNWGISGYHSSTDNLIKIRYGLTGTIFQKPAYTSAVISWNTDTNPYGISSDTTLRTYQTLTAFLNACEFETESSPISGYEEYAYAKNNSNQKTKIYNEIRPEDRPYLIPITTEIAGISQTVSNGVAALDIYVNASDHSAGMVFQANSGGSSIAMYANTVAIKSDDFNLDSTGFTFNKGNTSLDANGILRAKGAIIEGTIKANSFEATSTSGSVTRATVMDGNQFSISATGTISGHSVTGNSLYIQILDSVANENQAIKDENNNVVSTLYGVPTLCMWYNNVSYYLSPANWKSFGGTTLSNMRFIKKYDYDFVRLTSYTSPSAASNDNDNDYYYYNVSSVGNAYVFHPNNMNYVNPGDHNTLYQLKFQNATSTNYTSLNTNGLKETDSSADDGAYALDSGTIRGYIGFGSITQITSSNISIYKNLVLPENASFSFGIRITNFTNPYYNSGVTSITDYGQNKIFNLLFNLIAANAGSFGSSEWVFNGNRYTLFSNSSESVYKPFTSTGTSQGAFTLEIYPIYNISDRYTVNDSSTQYAWVKCTATYDKTNINTSIGQYGTLDELRYSISFNMLVKFSSSVTTYQNVESKINSILKNIDKISTYKNYFYNWMDIQCTAILISSGASNPYMYTPTSQG